MKFFCTQKNLNRGLSVCEKIITRNFTLPILQNILLTCEKNKGILKLSSTDLEIGVEVLIPAKIEKEGTLTLPAKLLNSFIESLPEEKIEIEEKDKNVYIKCNNYNSAVKSESSKEFPIIPKLAEEKAVTLKSNSFLEGISSVLSSVSITDTKPEISGVYTQFNEEDICFVGTDSFRLSEKRIGLDKKNKITNKVIIPRKTCDVFLRIFQNNQDNFNFYSSKNQIVLQNRPEDTMTPKIKIVSRVIEGEYPDYEQIIPDNFLTNLQVNRENFIQHIKTAGLFSSKTNNITLKVLPKKQKVSILSKDQEFGKHSSEISCKIQGQEGEVSFNYIYLLDGLNSINFEVVSLKLNKETTPALLESSGEKNFKYVIMPIKA